MKLRAGRLGLCSVAAALILVGVSVAPAEAVSAADAGPVAQLKQFWKDNGVDPATVDALVTKFEETGSVDSLAGAVPPASVKTVVLNGVKKSVQVYPDGSVVTTSQEVETSRARSIAGCTVVSGSGYRQFQNCRVAGDNGIVGLGFYATYTLVQGAYDNIGAHSGAGATCSFGSCSNPSWARAKTQEDSTGKAIVTEQVTYTTVAGSTTTNQLSLLVGADSATTSFQ